MHLPAKKWMLRQLPWVISVSRCFSCCFSYIQRWLPHQTTSSQSHQPVGSLIRVLFWVYIMRVSCFKLEVLDLCNFLLCLQRRREAHEILLFKSVLGRGPRQIRVVPDTTKVVCTANVVYLSCRDWFPFKITANDYKA